MNDCQCLYCNRIYQPKRPNRNKYCSRECAFAAKRAKPKPVQMATCRWCGQEFVKHGQNVYCSDECRRERARVESRKYSVAKKQLVPRQCKCCGKVFVPEYGNKKRVFCSDKCLERWNRRQHNVGHKTLNARARHLIRKRYGAVLPIMYEPIKAQKVYERDRWICGICGQPIDRRAHAPESLSPSVDHVVALAAGGSHTYGNVQAAHFECNWKKRSDSV